MAANPRQKLEVDDIQGLVISGYGHLGHACYLFLQFNDGPQGRAWLDGLIPEIATGAPWPKDENNVTLKPSSILNVAFTYSGLRKLVGDEAHLETLPPEFVEGMTFGQRPEKILGDTEDNDPHNWEFGGWNEAAGKSPEDMHAILIILAETADLRESLFENQQSRLQENNIEILARQDADKLPDSKEHFGFRDGISQPHIAGSTRPQQLGDPLIKTGEFVLGYPNEYGQFPDVPRLNGDERLGLNGTYLVFRKLYQDVASFWNFMADYAVADEGQQPDADTMTWLASKFVGRWPSGLALVLSPDKDNPDLVVSKENPARISPNINMFLYHKRDPMGEKCPFSSHVRRMNPRDSLDPNPEESLIMANRHMIIRRGMTFGAPLFPLDKMPDGRLEDDGQDRGLIFICMNANINRQFEFIQQTWANNPKFHSMYNDKDPIIGNNKIIAFDTETTHFTIPESPVRKRVRNIPRFVHVRGGGYFFLPGITGLRLIAGQE